MNPTRFTVNRPSVIHDTQGGETVVIDLESGLYFRLDPPSTRLWERLAVPVSLEELLTSCENRDDFAPEAGDILASLQSRNLVRPADRRDPEPPPAEATTWRFEGFRLEEFSDLEDILGLDPIHEVDMERGWPYPAAS